ncbi:MAG TPA: hypothetical protein VK974_01440 [Methylophilaceae bacterium]|nr:hypothetical protein [Methylophilaceae bacterium]
MGFSINVIYHHALEIKASHMHQNNLLRQDEKSSSRGIPNRVNGGRGIVQPGFARECKLKSHAQAVKQSLLADRQLIPRLER